MILLSEPKLASSQLTLKQGFNSLSTTFASIAGSFVFYFLNFTPYDMALMDPTDYRRAEAEIVQIPYMGLAAVLFMMALAMFSKKSLTSKPMGSEPAFKKDVSRLTYVLQIPHLYLRVMALFL